MGALWLLCLVLLAAYLIPAFESSFVVEHPLNTILVYLTCSGLSTLLLAKYLQHTESVRDQCKEDLPKHRSLKKRERCLRLPGFSADHPGYACEGLTLALALRSIHVVWLSQHIECTGQSLESLLPVALAIWLWVAGDKTPWLSASLVINASIACLLSSLTIAFHHPARSTYLCASSSPYVWLAPLSQHLGSVLDLSVIACLGQLFSDKHNAADRLSLRIHNVALALLYAAATTATLSMLIRLLTGSRHPYFTHDNLYLWSLAKLLPLVAAAVVSLIMSMHSFGALITTTVIALVTSTTSATAAIRSYSSQAGLPLRSTYAPLALTGSMLAAIVLVQTIAQSRFQTGSQTTTTRVCRLLQIGAITITIYHVKAWLSYDDIALRDTFAWNINSQRSLQDHRETLYEYSTTLAQAVTVYHNVHGRWPPPGFDEWYKYATERKSKNVDVFDNMLDDILPFHAMTPAEIRNRTHDLIVNPWNDVVGILIRDGRAHTGPHVNTNNRAMVEGLLRMINNFAEHLPDMDLAFNTNDGGRVIVPYETIITMREKGELRDNVMETSNSYQPGRATHWPRITGESISNNIMQELSSSEDVYRFSTVGCEPQSPARTENYWAVGNICSSCALNGWEETISYVPYGWEDLHDVCRKIDLHRMHGAYSAPTKFKATHKLYPVFSHSKAPGFNDLLYPSVWDYLGKIEYAPSKARPDDVFREKKDTLFWRGGTTEGVSFNDWKWQGMLRQRFVHLANNIKGASPPALVLTPRGGDEQETASELVRYEEVAVEVLRRALKPDVLFTPDITNCREQDCDIQRWEFAPTPNVTDFQEHWQYKYLLDLDGPSTSARFLPFLRSRSLPFKATIMQEWWQDRVRPWAHFIPLDVQGYSFWTALVWFMGFEGEINGRHVSLPAHQREAEQIAMAGRELAEKMLRKEDMEIYMFRLLLEWARVTDDWRDDIGFTGL